VSKEWVIAPEPQGSAQAARQWGVPPLVAQLLLNRGLSPQQPVGPFLSPQLKDIHEPRLLAGAAAAADRVVAAIQARQRIVIFGDYDVDGTAGVAILLHVLRAAEAQVSFYVPHRIDEGYGLNREAALKLVAEGAALIITVDCGISATTVAQDLRQAGVPLIITDHHTPGPELPEADVIVHPAVGGTYPNPDLCGAGVAFKLAWMIAQRLSGAPRVAPGWRQLLIDLLPLAALGTIADVVPLLGENRILARHGLSALSQTPWPGLRALIEAAGLNGARIDSYDVGFKLAPRINAAGRMGHARLAVELLTCETPERAREIALYLDDQNRQRQATETRLTREAGALVERDGLAGDAHRGIVLAGANWHAGVLGIVAAKLVDRYHRPAVLISLNGSEGQGSARSVRHFDMFAALHACREHLLAYGGHAMAAGLRIKSDCVPAFTEAFVAQANQALTGVDLVPKLRLDAAVDLTALTLTTAEVVANLGPFGTGNPKPRLATQWVELADEPRSVGREQNHLQAVFAQNGVQMRGIGFGLAPLLEDLKQHRRCRVAFEPMINDFNGRRSVEMRILDVQFPEKGDITDYPSA